MRGTLEFRGYWLFVVLSVVVAFPQTLRAQPGADDFQLLTYEVGDLIIDIHDHPYSDALQRTSAGSGSNRFGYKNQVSHQIKFAQFGGEVEAGEAKAVDLWEGKGRIVTPTFTALPLTI